MATKGYDFFVTKPGQAEIVRCRVCGRICDVTRDRFGPTGWAMALGGRGVPHDRFECPKAHAPSHARALRLLQEAEGTASHRLRDLMVEELEEIVAGLD